MCSAVYDLMYQSGLLTETVLQRLKHLRVSSTHYNRSRYLKNTSSFICNIEVSCDGCVEPLLKEPVQPLGTKFSFNFWSHGKNIVYTQNLLFVSSSERRLPWLHDHLKHFCSLYNFSSEPSSAASPTEDLSLRPPVPTGIPAQSDSFVILQV